MGQLQLFTNTELAKMRDRSASRNYSPARDEFRREHEQRRAWGLKRRHAERLARVAAGSRPPSAAPTFSGDRQDPARPPQTQVDQEDRPPAHVRRQHAVTRSTKRQPEPAGPDQPRPPRAPTDSHPADTVP